MIRMMLGQAELLEQEQWATVAARSHARPHRASSTCYVLPVDALSARRPQIQRCVPGAIRSDGRTAEHGGGPARRRQLPGNGGFFQEIDHPVTGPLTYPGYHFTLHRETFPTAERSRCRPRRRAPLLGEHTNEVLTRAESSVDPAEAPAASVAERERARRGHQPSARRQDERQRTAAAGGRPHPRLHGGVGGAVRGHAARRLGRRGDSRRVPVSTSRP